MGGVINTVTKSGSNDFHGTAGLQYQGNQTSGGLSLAPGSVISGSGPTVYSTGVPNLRTSLTDDNVSEYVTYPGGRLQPLRTEHLARRSDRARTRCGSSARTTRR